ncbi:ROK family transcriptional regulator, partial [Eubacteriales bacterium OttesenSCG-928-N13]|nr:ROK family transcriptional regulator [Eubacteriales bacterium OttesenSCG-928-N13]
MKESKSAGREIKLRNKIRILHYVYKQGKTTKQQLAEALSMSLPTVLQNVKELSKEGMIQIAGQMESTGGRKAAVIMPVQDVRMSVGVDITRNHVSLVLVNLTGDIVHHRRHPFAYQRAESYYAEVGRLIDAFITECDVDPDVVLGVGFAIPGIILNEGTMISYSHVLDIRNVPCSEFSNHVRYPCHFINDANAAGLAEVHTDGIPDTFVYLSLNNCVGGAIFTDGEMGMGDNMRAGEFGHMRLMPWGRRCYCGMDGCVDAYCNARLLADETNGDMRLFFERLREGDAHLAQVWDAYLDALAIAVNNLRMAFDCPVVLGGY